MPLKHANNASRIFCCWHQKPCIRFNLYCIQLCHFMQNWVFNIINNSEWLWLLKVALPKTKFKSDWIQSDFFPCLCSLTPVIRACERLTHQYSSFSYSLLKIACVKRFIKPDSYRALAVKTHTHTAVETLWHWPVKCRIYEKLSCASLSKCSLNFSRSPV